MRLDCNPCSNLTLQQKKSQKNRLDVENDMRLVHTNTPTRISRLVTQLQAQSSHWLIWVLFVMHMNVNTVNATCKIMCFYLVGCFLNPIKVAVNGWGWATMSYFWRGSRAYVIFSNGVARWIRLGTIDLEPKMRTAEEILILLPKKKPIVFVCMNNVRSYVCLFISRNYLL